MIKSVWIVYLLFCWTHIIACSQNGGGEKPDNGLLSFALKAGGREYHGVIDTETFTVTIGGIKTLSQISGVTYKVADGAEITPLPESLVGKWVQDQKFTVKGKSGSKVYTVHLKDLETEPARKVVIGYLPASDWEYDAEFRNIRWQYLTHLNVSFLHVTANGDLQEESVSGHLAEIRDEAEKHGIKVLISLNSDSKKGFAAAIKDPAIRTKLVDNTLAFARKYKLDGIDIDFEVYEAVGPDLLAFVRELHEKKDKEMLLTSAVANWNPGQGYSTDWHKYFDYINLMAYDFTGGWAKEGQHASYEQSIGLVDLWLTTLQAPASKLVLGLPFYGYSWDNISFLDEVKAIRYHQILTQYPGQEVSQKDQVGRTYYNGKPTLIRKCEYVKENHLAGVMIWQLFQDAKEESESLLKVVGESMND